MDGRPWRVLPDEVVVRVGLSPGRQLDRPTLRAVGRELRRAEALGRAGRALARRDQSEAALCARLLRGGAAPRVVAETAETLRRAGALDDGRFASGRAAALADRGWGNAAISARLELEGAPPDAIAEALGRVAPETERAARILERLPARKAAASLLRRGFEPDTVETLLARLDETP